MVEQHHHPIFFDARQLVLTKSCRGCLTDVIHAVECIFICVPCDVVCLPSQVELPLGATEDRICGTIDIEKALQEGIKAYEPGLLVCITIVINIITNHAFFYMFASSSF